MDRELLAYLLIGAGILFAIVVAIALARRRHRQRLRRRGIKTYGH